MTREEHIARHKFLHDALDELIADWIRQTDKLPSRNTVMSLMEWSHQQTLAPTDPTHGLVGCTSSNSGSKEGGEKRNG